MSLVGNQLSDSFTNPDAGSRYPGSIFTIMKTIQLIIAFVCMFVLTTNAQQVQRPVPGNIETYIHRFDIDRVDKNNNGWANYYIPRGMGDTLTVKMSCVFKGTATHAPHSHNEDEAFYIVKGPVNFHINGEERILNTGDFVYTPSGSSHNIQRVGNDTILYLVLKRETLRAVDKPHSVGKPGYTMADCCYYPAYDPVWVKGGDVQITLLDKAFADGYQVRLNRVTDDRLLLRDTDLSQSGQVALYLLQGKAMASVNGMEVQLQADNTLYCPKTSSYSLRNNGQEPLVFLSITTE